MTTHEPLCRSHAEFLPVAGRPALLFSMGYSLKPVSSNLEQLFSSFARKSAVLLRKLGSERKSEKTCLSTSR